MFKKILIANRGEIALRVVRACREMGILSVAVHSTADADAMHVRMADEAVCIGPPPAGQSYLLVPALISACEITGAEAIHPGYGFLSENADFARACEQAGIVFVGPPSTAIDALGNKSAAKLLAQRIEVPWLSVCEDWTLKLGEIEVRPAQCDDLDADRHALQHGADDLAGPTGDGDTECHQSK